MIEYLLKKYRLLTFLFGSSLCVIFFSIFIFTEYVRVEKIRLKIQDWLAIEKIKIEESLFLKNKESIRYATDQLIQALEKDCLISIQIESETFSSRENEIYRIFRISDQMSYPLIYAGNQFGFLKIQYSIRKDVLLKDISFFILLLVISFYAQFLFLKKFYASLQIKIIKPLHDLYSLMSDPAWLHLDEYKNLKKTDHEKFPEEIKTIFDSFYHLTQSISQYRKLEIDYVKSSTLKSITSQVVHDLRSPLTTLKIICQSIHKNLSKESQFILDANFKRVDAIISDLLLRKNQTAEHQPDSQTSLKEIVDEIFSSKIFEYKDRKDLMFKLFLPTSSSIIHARINSSHLKRAISNVINNAVEASPHGGIISLELKNESYFSEISIQDHGIGMPAFILNQLGQEGLSYNKLNGSGLGLSFTVNFLHEIGGEFDVNSEPNRGTKVTLKIPKIQGELNNDVVIPIHYQRRK